MTLDKQAVERERARIRLAPYLKVEGLSGQLLNPQAAKVYDAAIAALVPQEEEVGRMVERLREGVLIFGEGPGQQPLIDIVTANQVMRNAVPAPRYSAKPEPICVVAALTGGYRFRKRRVAVDYDKILAELQAIREDGERVQRHIKNARNSLDQALQTTEELLAVEESTVRIGPIGG